MQNDVEESSRSVHLTEFLIEPRKGLISLDWQELWNYRELLYFLIWRDIKVRYKQTSLGIAWAVLQPLLGTFIFTIIFGRLAKMPSDNFPYQVFVYAGLIPWTFFSNGITQAALSLVGQQNLITKVYFPRIFLPVATVATGLVDMAISFALYAIILLWYHIAPTANLLFLPLLILLSTLAAAGVGIFLAALTVMYRDFRYVIPFTVQIWMYASPVVYPVSLVPAEYKWLLALNPMAGIIDGYRAAILGAPLDANALLISIVVSSIMFFLGLTYFRKTERQFADIA